MILLLKNVLTKNECQRLNDVAFAYLQESKFVYEGKEKYYANSYGCENIPEYQSTLKQLTSKIVKLSDKEIRPETVYTRAYFNGSRLKRHQDRKHLDLSLSICTFKSIQQEWPLYIEKNDGSVETYTTEPGDGVLFQGRRYWHWRDDLNCSDEQLVLQTFFHWRVIGADKDIQQPVGTMA
jgi:alkylated DNA repair dioxygenase AlkB